MRRLLSVLSLAFLLSLLLMPVGCAVALPGPMASAPQAASSANTEAAGERTVQDLLGRQVALPRHVQRVAAAGPGALRLIVYLQAQDMVVGVEDAENRWDPAGRPYIMAHPELRGLPSIGPGGPGNLPDAEALVQVNPDVLFLTYVDGRTADNLQSQTGIPVVVLSYGDDPFSQELLSSLELAGSILGTEERAAEVVAFVKETLADLDRRTADIPDSERPTTYVGGIGYKGAHGLESTESAFPVLRAVHARNVADELPAGHHMVDREKIVEWDPEIIFLDEGGLELVLQDFAKSPDFYRSLTAFRKGQVYGLLPYNYYSTNVETALADAYFAGKVLYPERFADVDPAAKADELYAFLVGKPLYAEMKEAFGGFGKLDLESATVQ